MSAWLLTESRATGVQCAVVIEGFQYVACIYVSVSSLYLKLSVSSLRVAVVTVSSLCLRLPVHCAYHYVHCVCMPGPANLGIEFWGQMGSTYFSDDKPVFSWGGSPDSRTSDCRTYLQIAPQLLSWMLEAYCALEWLPTHHPTLPTRS